MRTFVSLDIETTGLDPDRDAILEIGVVKFRGDDVLDEWDAIIDPARPIPAKITELTGITPEMVQREAISLWGGLREVQRIVGNAPIIGHNIGFDLGFLRRQRAFTNNLSIDTFELASILVPHAGRYSLGALAAELGITLPATHRALNDARVAHQLYLRVFERASELQRETLDEICRIADMSGWTLSDFWRDAREHQERGSFSTSIGAAIKKTSSARRSTLVRRLSSTHDAKPLKPNEKIVPLEIDAVAKLLSSEGAFAKQFPNYESRPQQVDMLRQVVKTFNENGVSFIEAGTGTGKSIAYLVPSMLWALQNNQRVVVSTNTINLQEQLVDKDVPEVIRILGKDVHAAVMKGKGRYVCPNRLSDLRKKAPTSLSLDEVRVLTKILIWQPNTLTGDADELFIPSPGERAAFSHLSAQNPICNVNTCSATDCYFHQARRLAESAHVVVVNHALLLADIAVENRALPEYKYLVIDEAHHLESAATDSLTYSIDRDEFGRMLSDLGRTSGRSRATGMLPDIASAVRKSVSVDKSASVERQTDEAMNQAASVWASVGSFFDELIEFLADQVQGDSDYTQKVRLTGGLRTNSGWSRVEIEFDKLSRDLSALLKMLDQIYRNLGELSEVLSDFDTLMGRLKGANNFFVEASEQLNFIISKPQDKQIYWAEVTKKKSDYGRKSDFAKVILNAAPLHVGEKLQKTLWETKEAVILTSATMQTSNSNSKGKPSFEYVKSRLSATDANEFAVGSPFDYKSSTLVYLVTDIPEPNQQGYQQVLERALIELFSASEGRGLALFTSYSALRQTAKVIAPELQRHDIMLYEQGDGTSRRVMIEQFRAAERGVMLGTKSFWEGVDIQGDKLSTLAICKLPFDVPSDPIFSARSETFENAFNEYSVPETVLRFRQGFGRLIRSKSDRGVILVLDRRLISKSYGAAFLNALPNPTLMRAPIGQMGKAVRDWLGRTK
jgi:DNA polymerase-3 subunit epsilon/ATP-dependent DNA helicase DinG